MIAAVFVLGLAFAQAAQQPDIFNGGFVSRNGRQAHLRVINRLATQSASLSTTNFNVNGLTVTSMSDSVNVRVKHGATFQTLFDISTTPSTAFSTITKIDAGAAATIEAHFSFGGQTIVRQCGTISPSTRATAHISQTITQPVFNAPTCSISGSSCNTAGTLANKGNVEVQCSLIATDNLSSGRSCATVPVRFFNERAAPTCDDLIEDAALSTSAAKAFLNAPVSPGRNAFGTTIVSFDRKSNLKLNDIPLFSSGDRFVDVHVPVTGPVVSQGFKTGFVNIANVAHRLVSSSLANTFKVVVLSDGVSVTRENVVHVFQSISAGSASGWIELPAGVTYHLALFETSVTDAQLFGDTTSSSSLVASPPVPIATGTIAQNAGVLAENAMIIFRIVGSGGSPSINSVPLNGDNIVDSTTKTIVWNNIESLSVKFAAPKDDCCNYAFGSRTSPLENNVNFRSAVLKSSDNAQFDVFPGSASDQCSSIGPKVISTSNALSFTPVSSGCEVEGVILHGRFETFSETVSTGCVNPTTQSVSKTRVVSLTTAPSTTGTTSSESNDITLSFEVTMCSCSPPPSGCVALPLTCEEVREQQAQIAQVSTLIAASTAAISSAVSASQTSLSATLANVSTVLADTNADVANTNTTLLAAITTRSNGLASDIASFRSRVERKFGGLEDDVEDLADDIESVADAI